MSFRIIGVNELLNTNELLTYDLSAFCVLLCGDRQTEPTELGDFRLKKKLWDILFHHLSNFSITEASLGGAHWDVICVKARESVKLILLTKKCEERERKRKTKSNIITQTENICLEI